MRQAVARGLLEDERRGGGLLGLGGRGQRVFPEPVGKVIVAAFGGSVLGPVSNDKIETRFRAPVVGVGRAAVAVEAVDGPGRLG